MKEINLRYDLWDIIRTKLECSLGPDLLESSWIEINLVDNIVTSLRLSLGSVSFQVYAMMIAE